MKKQVVVIHGGHAFFESGDFLDYLKNKKVEVQTFKSKPNKNWRENLEFELGSDFEVFYPEMPNKENARYPEWKIWFEKLVPFLNDEIILVGHSLGGIFLAKYLSENKISKKIKAVFLVAAVFDGDVIGNQVGTFALPSKLDLQTEKIYLYQSKDDPAVPFSAMDNYKKLLPFANCRVFTDRGHFRDEKFPEIVEDIQGLYS